MSGLHIEIASFGARSDSDWYIMFKKMEDELLDSREEFDCGPEEILADVPLGEIRIDCEGNVGEEREEVGCSFSFGWVFKVTRCARHG